MKVEFGIEIKETRYHLEEALALITEEILLELADPKVIEDYRKRDLDVIWLDYMYRIGTRLEDLNRDHVLPALFWQHLACAAYITDIVTDFIPYLLGKSQGKPKRSIYDVIAAVIVIYKNIDESWQRAYSNLFDAIGNIVEYWQSLSPSYA